MQLTQESNHACDHLPHATTFYFEYGRMRMKNEDDLTISFATSLGPPIRINKH